MIKVLVSPSNVCNIFINSSVPPSSSELSNTSSNTKRFVFTEFFNFATALHVNNNARSILIFSPSLKFAYENASRYLDLIDSLNPSSRLN